MMAEIGNTTPDFRNPGQWNSNKQASQRDIRG
jgi:hypothetical protein